MWCQNRLDCSTDKTIRRSDRCVDRQWYITDEQNCDADDERLNGVLVVLCAGVFG